MKLKAHYPLYLAGRPVETRDAIEVRNKFTGEIVSSVSSADTGTIDHAIGASAGAARAMAELPPYERRRILLFCIEKFTERADELAGILCVEAGKPIRDSRGEVSRLIDTFSIAADESIRISGEVMNLEISPRVRGYRGMYKRVPVGPCSFITPFNFPLNLVAHKVAPAIAAGCPFILKPASLTPVGALVIGEILAGAGLPAGAFSILPCPRSAAGLFAVDERLKLLSFTGSPDAGWELKRRAGKKKVVLELGGNAACIVDEGVDLADAVNRIVTGAFYQSGQSCISVQRIMVHRSLYEELKSRLVDTARNLPSGDPGQETTFIGPLISESAAQRVMSWIDSAVNAGATLLCGGRCSGNVVEATLLENVPADQPVCAAEVFGPVAVLSAFDSFEDALEQINASRYGLQAGVFTRDIGRAMQAWDRLEVGGVIINDIPSWRVDHMPYGGVKDSGLGREGIRFAIEEMTEIRNLVIRSVASSQ